ncbi:MAG: type II/IV secretion system protein [candidate division SR1 bacterium]|nr:type II/IV secretion system protein [candidate division SR1 bacterium]
MATSLNPALSERDPDSVNLSIISTSKKLRIQRIKSDLDHAFIEADTKETAVYLSLPYIDLYGFPIDTGYLALIRKADAIKYHLGVFNIVGTEAEVATPQPNFPGQKIVLDRLKRAGYKTKMYFVSNLSFSKLIKTYDSVLVPEIINDNIDLHEDLFTKFNTDNFSLVDTEKTLTSLSLSNIVDAILAIALNFDASDIHFEPEKESYNIRFRLDGVLHTIARLPAERRKPIESRLKLISGLKLNVDNIPQDGRFSFHAHDKDVDVRVSMLPSNYGYSVVMRLLGTGSISLVLKDLGFSGLAKARVDAAIERPQGLILTTGPTGSGKTTTLYTFLNSMNDGEGKIITLEDPIEYKLPGISQTQIDANAGYTFASGLRSILRQDPDLVMVGEIRDGETAEIAVQASLTGHQVLSTIHTNDAAGAIPRLMEMGIKGFLLADSLQAVIGQRLVRKLCIYCKTVAILDDNEKKIVIKSLSTLPKIANITLPEELTFYTAPGCEKCERMGYKGRIGCYEILTMTDGLKSLVSEQYPSIVQVRQTAINDGMVTMFQDGVLKALEGITDIKELIRNIDSGS